MSHSEPPLSVSEVTRDIKRLLEGRFPDLEIAGEIGNWKCSARGHAYFTLKDAEAALSCVLFAGSLGRLSFEPGEGMQVVARGSVSVYAARGQYQLIVRDMDQAGVGELYRRFLELKAKLEGEGLFDSGRKRPLPPYPRRIGLVTSPGGAALRDILHVIRRRFSGVELVLAPTLVQGTEAPAQIVRAIERLGRLRFDPREDETGRPALDLMIVGRGGGSIEDLWAFNDEVVARAIAACPVPVISAVGHETDFTIADFVADERAPTPSAAAERAVAEMARLRDDVRLLQQRLARALENRCERSRLELSRLLGSWGLRRPLDLLRESTQRLDDLGARAEQALLRRREDQARRLETLTHRLRALDPEAVLERGYSIVTLARNSKALRNPRQARVGDHLAIRLAEGSLRAGVLAEGEDFLDGQL